MRRRVKVALVMAMLTLGLFVNGIAAAPTCAMHIQARTCGTHAGQ